VGNCQALVIGNQTRALGTVQDPENPQHVQIAYADGGGTTLISRVLSGGELGGTLDFRREVLDKAQNALDRIAAVLADTFNAQHRNGIDLNGGLGADFFTIPPPQVIDHRDNTGSATVTGIITDATALTASSYRLTYDGAAYTLYRLSDGASVSGGGPTLTMDGFELTVGGAAVIGDSFLVEPVGHAAREIAVALTNPREIAAGVPVRTEASLGNLGSGTVSEGVVLDATGADLFDRVELRFNDPPTTFDVVNTTDSVTLASNVPFASGANIEYNGWRVNLEGSPLAGDIFVVERNIGGINDNRNALALADLQRGDWIDGASTYQQAYGALLGQVGALTRQAEVGSQAQDRLLNQAREARDSVSRVNLDEEAMDMLRFQQAYQAAAQVIAVSDQLFDSLLAAVGR
jgi:flagellar hook-associated protein 1 FlgK